MWSYFKRWRRKLGVITLSLAFVFGVFWIRSFFCDDGLAIGFQKSPIQYVRNDLLGIHLFRTRSTVLDELTRDFPYCAWIQAEANPSAKRKVLGHYYWQYWTEPDQRLEFELIISHWVFTTPLIVISFLLLMSKCRKPKPNCELQA